MLLNAGRLGQNNKKFYFNKEGVNKGVASVLYELDNERLAIGKKFGFSLLPFLDVMKDFYGEEFSSFHDFFSNTNVLNKKSFSFHYNHKFSS